MPRYIFHIDVNSAFLSWEAVYRLRELNETLDIRLIPSVVGGDINTRHGVVVAKSTPAKSYGIVTGEPITEAFKKCPTLKHFSPNFQLYRRYSNAFISILREYTDTIEQFSIDEAWCDMSKAVDSKEKALALATLIANRIRNELGFTINIGISHNKLLAKMASDFEKPDKIHTLYPDEIKEKMWPLPVRDLFFVGKSTEKKLYNLGIITIGDLANANTDIINYNLKKHGQLLFEYANGLDNSPIITERGANKGFGNSTTVPFDIIDIETAKEVLSDLASTVSNRLKKANARAGCISVTMRDTDFTDMQKQCTLTDTICDTKPILDTSLKLLLEIWDGHSPLRLLGIATSHITYNEDVQYTIFDYSENEIKNQDKLSDALNKINAKYGAGTIKKGLK